MEFKVLLNRVEDVKQFVDAASLYDCEITVSSFNNRYEVNAASIMGIFSLDLSKPVIVHIKNKEAGESFKCDVEKFISY